MNQGNHRLLKDSEFVCDNSTAEKFPLIIQGLPFLLKIPGKGFHVLGEVYRVSDSTMKRLDQLEGHPTFYKREKIKLRFFNLTAWVYFYQTPERFNSLDAKERF